MWGVGARELLQRLPFPRRPHSLRESASNAWALDLAQEECADPKGSRSGKRKSRGSRPADETDRGHRETRTRLGKRCIAGRGWPTRRTGARQALQHGSHSRRSTFRRRRLPSRSIRSRLCCSPPTRTEPSRATSARPIKGSEVAIPATEGIGDPSEKWPSTSRASSASAAEATCQAGRAGAAASSSQTGEAWRSGRSSESAIPCTRMSNLLTLAARQNGSAGTAHDLCVHASEIIRDRSDGSGK